MQAALHIDATSYARMVDDMKRLVNDLNWTYPRALAYAGTQFARSMSGGTKLAEKLRPVIENPDSRAGKDRRVALFGVMKLRQEKPPKFVPIYRTGEFGKVRFFDEETMSYFQRDAADPKGRWEHLPSGPDFANPEIEVPGIMTDKRRTIGRRGLAKKSWQWMAKHTRKGGIANIFDTPDAAQVRHSGQGAAHTLSLINRLSYVLHANKGGLEGYDGAMMRAADGMRHLVEKKLKAAGAK